MRRTCPEHNITAAPRSSAEGHSRPTESGRWLWRPKHGVSARITRRTVVEELVGKGFPHEVELRRALESDLAGYDECRADFASNITVFLWSQAKHRHRQGSREDRLAAYELALTAFEATPTGRRLAGRRAALLDVDP